MGVLSVNGEVSNTDTSASTIGTAGSKTDSTTDVTNTISNLVKSLQAQTTIVDTSNASDSKNTGSSASATTTAGTSSGKSTTTSDESSLALSRGIAAQALSNSVDSTQTNDLVSGIIRKAAIGFAPTRVATNNSGSYNNASVGMLSDQAQADAVGTAAGAVLNYKTAQQQIAESVSGQLLGANKVTTDSGATSQVAGTTGSSTADTTSTGTSHSGTAQATAGSTQTDATINTLTKLMQNVFSNSTSSSTGSTTSEKGGFSLSIVCTELMVQKKMDRKTWFRGMQKFAKVNEAGKQGYYIWARVLVKELKERPCSKKSTLIAKLFLARAKGNFLAISLVWTISFLCGLYWIVFIKDEQLEIGARSYD